YYPVISSLLVQADEFRPDQGDIGRSGAGALRRQFQSQPYGSFSVGQGDGRLLDWHASGTPFKQRCERLQPPLAPELPESLRNALSGGFHGVIHGAGRGGGCRRLL